MPGVLQRYRVMCFAAGVMSLLLWFVELPVKYLLDLPEVEAKVLWIPIVHGYIYALYVLATVHLAIKARWQPKRIIAFVLAGTLPIASFITERRAQILVKNL
jgi:integral membrane protein